MIELIIGIAIAVVAIVWLAKTKKSETTSTGTGGEIINPKKGKTDNQNFN